MRLLLASGCLPERAGQPAQIQLHLTLDELLGMPGAADAARTWLARHLGTDPADHQDASSQEGGSYPGDSSQPGGTTSSAAPADHPGTSQPDGTTSSAASADYPGTSQPGGSGQPGEAQAGASASGAAPGEAQPGAPGGGSSGSGNPDLDELLWPDPFRTFSKPIPAAIRRAGGAGQAGWLTGKAAEAYACDAKIAPMVCGHLDRNLLARAVTDFLAGDLANLVTSSDPLPAPRPRCECDEHPARRRAPIPGALPITAPPAAPTDPVTPGLTAVGAPSGTVRRLSPTPGGLARLQDTLLRYAVSLLSGPTGLAAYLRTQLTGGFFPAASLPLDLGQPTEEVPPHLRRAVIKRDRHCSFPGCSLPPVRCHIHHIIPRSKGGPTRLDNLTLLCAFHHLIVIHRRGWSLTLHGDGTTTAKSPDGIRTLHSHGPPPGQDTLWPDQHGPPATAA